MSKDTLRFANLDGRPEIFTTVQGEGRTIGAPAVFARLSGCNLQCVWCDTPYTWNWTGTKFEHQEDTKYDRKENTLQVTIGEAVDQITESPIKRVVITGGEPMLQQAGIVGLIDSLREQDPNYRFEVETNGTIAPTTEMIERVDQFNISPKLTNSGMAENKRKKPEALKVFSRLANANFKFVIAGEQDAYEALDYMDEFQLPVDNVYLMPEGRTAEDINARMDDLVELAKQVGCNVTTRMHVLIWGAKKGV